MTVADNKALFQSFTKELYEHFEDADILPSKKDFLKFVSTFIADIPEVEPTRKSSGGRISTVPGAPFNQDLCRCRVWNKGFAKQCSSKKINGEFCKMHFSKIDEYGGWSYGNYDEPKPKKHLCDGAGKTKKGNVINWKSDDSYSVKKEISQEVQDLKKEYEQKLGKKPSGPKTNDAEWLQKKIDEYESDSDDSEKEEVKKKSKKKSSKKKSSSKKKKISQEVQDLKDEYEKKLGKKPSGPKANNAEWLQQKIDEYESDSDDSDDEKPSKDNNSDDEKPPKDNNSDDSDDEDPKSGIKPLELDLDESSTEFEYEGVTYYKKKSNGKWIVEDKSEDGEVVGHMSSDGESLIWTDECYEEMHKDHDDYNGEESD